MSGLCPRRGCGTALEFPTDGLGRVVPTCPACERNRNGLCRDCPALVRKGARRCPPCGSAHTKRRVVERSRALYADPEYRAQKLAGQKARWASMSEEDRRAAYLKRQEWKEEIPGYGSWSTMKWYRKNTEAATAARGRWYRKNKKRARATRRAYYADNPERFREYRRRAAERRRAGSQGNLQHVEQGAA